MTPEQIAEGRRLLAEATAGPWVQGRYGDGSMRAIVYASGDRSGERVCTISEMCEDGGELADASAIVWLRNNAAALLDAAEKAEGWPVSNSITQRYWVRVDGGWQKPFVREDLLNACLAEAKRELDELRERADAALAEAKAIRDHLQTGLNKQGPREETTAELLTQVFDEAEEDRHRLRERADKAERERDAAMAEVERMRADMLARQVHLDNGRTLKCGVCGEVATGVCTHIVAISSRQTCRTCVYRDKDVEYCVRNQMVTRDEEFCSRWREKVDSAAGAHYNNDNQSEGR